MDERVAWRRWLIVSAISLSIGAGLVVWLLAFAQIDASDIVGRLAAADPLWFTFVALLIAAYMACGSEKWRLVDVALRGSEQQPMPRDVSFALTMVGMVAGNVVPTQLSVAGARTLGTYLLGAHAVRRGAAGTLVEQVFDLLVMILLSAVTLVAISLQTASIVWWSAAVAVAALGIVSIGRVTVWLRAYAEVPLRKDHGGIASALRRMVMRLGSAGLLESSLATKLWALSFVRFVLLVLMARATGMAAGLDVPIWHLAAAMPFVSLATVTALTPAGLGVNEWTMSVTLGVLGTPLDLAAQWTVANRILMIAASIVVCCAAVLFALLRQRIRGR